MGAVHQHRPRVRPANPLSLPLRNSGGRDTLAVLCPRAEMGTRRLPTSLQHIGMDPRQKNRSTENS
eukprot:324320-Hanusia_phi.AAC.8